jgi:hypothetical protein
LIYKKYTFKINLFFKHFQKKFYFFELSEFRELFKLSKP